MSRDVYGFDIYFHLKFDEHPFLVKINGHEHLIGEGDPTFTVNFKKVIPLKDLITSTSLALGEAYMDGDFDIEDLRLHYNRTLLCWEKIFQIHGDIEKLPPVTSPIL